ncbi:MAG: hypothetical protein BWY49_00119 [Candidatus Omnitrophica bacterium ADurb.Bin314]|nr:MAG: hypothetical protein BWY49_00119 [Candidatus Omnitrophica bacterium ADurb.Bin314]
MDTVPLGRRGGPIPMIRCVRPEVEIKNGQRELGLFGPQVGFRHPAPAVQSFSRPGFTKQTKNPDDGKKEQGSEIQPVRVAIHPKFTHDVRDDPGTVRPDAKDSPGFHIPVLPVPSDRFRERFAQRGRGITELPDRFGTVIGAGLQAEPDALGRHERFFPERIMRKELIDIREAKKSPVRNPDSRCPDPGNLLQRAKDLFKGRMIRVRENVTLADPPLLCGGDMGLGNVIGIRHAPPGVKIPRIALIQEFDDHIARRGGLVIALTDHDRGIQDHRGKPFRAILQNFLFGQKLGAGIMACAALPETGAFIRGLPVASRVDRRDRTGMNKLPDPVLQRGRQHMDRAIHVDPVHGFGVFDPERIKGVKGGEIKNDRTSLNGRFNGLKARNIAIHHFNIKMFEQETVPTLAHQDPDLISGGEQMTDKGRTDKTRAARHQNFHDLKHPRNRPGGNSGMPPIRIRVTAIVSTGSNPGRETHPATTTSPPFYRSR